MNPQEAAPNPKEETLQIVHYPHPTLRYPSKTVRRVDNTLRQVVREMFDLMYAAQGVGLAANQVDLPLRLFVVNLEAKPGEGEELVFINPVITHAKGSDESEEGCLSLPGLNGMVRRSKQVRISAYNLAGEEFRKDVSGLMARVVQHEFDHINGILFLDRMTEEHRLRLVEDLAEFEADYESARDAGEIPSEDDLALRRAEWERRYC